LKYRFSPVAIYRIADGGKNRIIGLRGGALFNYVVNGGEVKEVVIDESCKITGMATLVIFRFSN